MKKIITITITFFLTLILLIGISIHNKNVEKINKSNLKEFINKTFGKDSENRGFSDELKSRIDSKIKEPEIREILYKQAIFNKKAILAETEEDYLKYVLQSDQIMNCASFLYQKYNIKITSVERISLQVDNNNDYETITNAVEYVRFNGYETTKKTIENFNKKTITIRNNQDYLNFCEKF